MISGFLGVVTLKSLSRIFVLQGFSHLSTNHRIQFIFHCTWIIKLINRGQAILTQQFTLSLSISLSKKSKHSSQKIKIKKKKVKTLHVNYQKLRISKPITVIYRFRSKKKKYL